MGGKLEVKKAMVQAQLSSRISKLKNIFEKEKVLKEKTKENTERRAVEKTKRRKREGESTIVKR